MYNDRSNKKSYNNRGNGGRNNSYDRPKPTFVTVPVIPDGTTQYGNEYDIDSLFEILENLSENNVFSQLSIPVSAEREIMRDDGPKTITKIIGNIVSYNIETSEMEIRLFNNATDIKKDEDNYCVNPKALTKKDSRDVIRIASFELKVR